jgi:zinc/manganese transport system permease protein
VIDALALLWAPFLVALCLVGIHTYFGIQVLVRNVIFVDLALAQVAALGTTVAFMLGHAIPSPAAYAYSLAFTLLAALLLAFTRTWSGRIPQEALIGVVYVVTAAAAILLIDRAPQGAEHLKQILTGNVLTTGMSELTAIVPLYAAIGFLHWMLRRRALAAGHRSWTWEFFFYASFGVVVTSSVAIAGVLLVFSFLIMPAAIGVLYSERLSRQLAIGWAVGSIASACGLAVSYVADLPTGAAMVCTFGAALALALLLHPFLRGDADQASGRLLRIVRIVLAVAFAASGIALMALPRADQPLLDALESLAPSVRELYFNKNESAIYRDAAASAERYRLETDRLNAMEVETRAQGVALDDAQVRRISSYLKSYNEMRRGEEFVKREVRSRARERSRWIMGAAAILCALLVSPGLVGLAREALRRRHQR